MRKYDNLYIIIPADKPALLSTPSLAPEETHAREAARIAAIYAGMGIFANTVKGQSGTEELLQERRKDNEKEEAQILGFEP